MLGQPGAPATLIEYNDLQCPACKAYATEVLPGVLSRYVRPERSSWRCVRWRSSAPTRSRRPTRPRPRRCRTRCWQFSDVLYRNQGIENTGYVDDGYIKDIASATPGLDVNRLLSNKDSDAGQGACLPVGEAG